MMEREMSFKKWVAGAGSSGSMHSSSRTYHNVSNRFGGFPAAPRPRIGGCSSDTAPSLPWRYPSRAGNGHATSGGVASGASGGGALQGLLLFQIAGLT